MPATKRMNITTSKIMQDVLDRLQIDTSLSNSETIRRAVALYYVAWRVKVDGLRLAVAGINGQPEEFLDVFSIGKKHHVMHSEQIRAKKDNTKNITKTKNISVSNQMRSELKEIENYTGLSKSEIIRRAVTLYSVAWKVKTDGKRLAITGVSGQPIEFLDAFSIGNIVRESIEPLLSNV